MEPATPKPGPRNPWPLCLIAFAVLAVLGCAALIVFSSFHRSELVAADYYEQEMRYQDQVDRMANAQQPGKGASVRYDPAQQVVAIALANVRSNTPVKGKIRLYRPSAAGLDRDLALTPDTAGQQLIDARSLAPGLWKVRISWDQGGKGYYVEQPVVVTAHSG